MSDITDPLGDSGADSAESDPLPRLLTPAEAAQLTGVSRKQITGRMDRGTLRVVKDEAGTRRVPRAELVRTGLLDPSHPGKSQAESGGELVIWRDMYEREREERAIAERQHAELRAQLAAIAHAAPIRAMRLRREARRQLREQQREDDEPEASA